MSILFEPFEFAGIHMRNRFVRSATVNNLTNEENRFTPALWKLYTDLARGGVGLILAGVYRPRREWAVGHVFQQPCLDVPGIADEMGELVDEVHRLGAVFVPQISPPFRIHGKQVSGASVDVSVQPQPLDERDMAEIRDAYRNAGRVCKEAGCDGVQMHCCHNDVLSRSISPYFNKRTDEYGGPPENRARFVVELIAAIKQGAGADFPVMIKMNGGDYLPEGQGGMTAADAAEIAVELQAGGIAAIEPSCGGTGASRTPSGPIAKEEWFEGFMVAECGVIKQAVDVPVMVVGGLRKPEMMEEIIASGKGDLISLCRPLIHEPGIINRWAGGDTAPSGCVSCDGCLTLTTRSQKLRCVHTTRPDGSPR